MTTNTDPAVLEVASSVCRLKDKMGHGQITVNFNFEEDGHVDRVTFDISNESRRDICRTMQSVPHFVRVEMTGRGR